MWDEIWRPRQQASKATRRRDPFSIGLAILINFGPVSPFLATLVGSAIIGAVALGASLLVSALTPQQQRPEAQNRQLTVRQPVSPRWRYYGRNKVGGLLWFFESKDGVLYSGTTLNEGQISAVQEIWLNDQLVTIDVNNLVNEAPYVFDGHPSVTRLYFQTGTSTQTVDPTLLLKFPGVITADHRLRGVATCLAMFEEVASEKIGEVYPQGNPGVRIVMDASIVKSVRTGSRIFSDNAADAIYDYLTGVDDAGFPYGAGKLESQVDLPSFQAFAALSDQLVPTKAGGTEKRYRLCGGYALNEEMRSVLPRMCKSCDADLYINGEGKIAIRGGRWVAPTLTLDSDLGHIISGEFRQGQSALAAFNELNITYVDPTQDYLDTEGERWLDTPNIALRGKVLPEQLDLPMVPSHAQARRLAKIHTAKSNPLWVGSIVTNFYGFNALGEETVTIKFGGPLGIDTTFLVQSVKILDDMTGVQLEVTSLSASAYEWDAVLEEGTGPGTPGSTDTPIALDPPADFTATVLEREVAGSVLGIYIRANWTEPTRTALSQQVQYRLLPSGDWFDMSVADGVGRAESGLISVGQFYEVRARTLAPSGVPGAWGATLTVYGALSIRADNDNFTVDSITLRADRT